jgi:hypothetical protein
MKKTKRIALMGCLAAALLAAPVSAAVVYSTVQEGPDLFAIAGNGIDALGDQVTLGGTDRLLTTIIVPLHTDEIYLDDLTLTLYSNDGADSNDGSTPNGNPTPSAVLASNIQSVSFGVDDQHDVTFDFTALEFILPESFTFALSQGNPGADGASS